MKERILRYKQYSMHLFGFIAFFFTSSLGILALLKHEDNDMNNLIIYLPYGIVIFLINIFYIKAIRLSRDDYEEKLKYEKEYSQMLLKSQKHFLRHAVHETNTPLAVIMANIELYEMEMGEHVALQNIEAATKNISGIYNDLSYLTQQDKIDYPKQDIILCEFVESRTHFFNIVAKQSGLKFDIIDKSSQANICINETKLQRIIDNNITNAIKYTHENETITIYLYIKEKKVIFEISSYSNIIKDPSHIFDAYYREDDQREGLGLGLNLVKKICIQEDVNIMVNSNEKKTTFTYSFSKATL